MAVFNGNGIVWDPDKNTVLCNFNKGPYHTTDEREQTILRRAGFFGNYEDEIVVIDDEDEEENEEALRFVAKSLGINHYWNKNIDNLKKEIQEKEGE